MKRPQPTVTKDMTALRPRHNLGEILDLVVSKRERFLVSRDGTPTAVILSGVLMLRHLGETSAADRLERAVALVVREGKSVTYDLKPDRNDPTAVGTRQMGEAIIAAMRR